MGFSFMAKVSIAPGGNEPAKGGSVPLPRSQRGIRGFFNEVQRELKKVSWPTRAETNRLTGVVLAVCFLCVALLSTMSWIFGLLIDMLTKGGK
jgi:preprotein translocase SecE subunit